MKKQFNTLSTFDGMACLYQALKEINLIPDNYYSSEIDKYPSEIAAKNHPEIIPLGDINFVSKENFSKKTKINLLTGGSPCQDLSGLKDGKGLEGEKSKLFFEFLRLKNELNPDFFLLENVVPRKKEWKEEIDRILGVKGKLINSDLFVQQNRPRYYWTNIPENTEPLPKRPEWKGNFYQYRRTYFRKNMNGVCPCLTANMGTGGHNAPLFSEDLTDRIPIELLEKYQGLPAKYTEGVSRSRRLQMIGNGWTIQPIKYLLTPLLKIYK